MLVEGSLERDTSQASSPSNMDTDSLLALTIEIRVTKVFKKVKFIDCLLDAAAM